VTGRLLRFAIAVVRGWTVIYTVGMPPRVRDERRAEIESDLWESQHGEHAGFRLPAQMMSRLVLGIHDDLRWRGDHLHAPRRLVQMIWALAAAVTGAVLLTAIWLGRASTLPIPVRPDAASVRVAAPPPPPPPPPPCSPPGTRPSSAAPCTRF
jgi:hypothetical protein